jgi:DNA-binding PadR family transcriptional regulator
MKQQRETSTRKARINGGGRGRRHKGGRRPRLGRLFAHGDLRFLILKLIAEKPRHGYDIIKAIEEQVAGTYSPSPGVIYPTLTLLEELDWISAAATEGKKRMFKITEAGSLSLEANKATVAAILDRMVEITEARADDAGTGPDNPAMPPQIQLALDDLTRVIERELAVDDPAIARIGAIAAALAKAAAEIEHGPAQ